MILAAGPLANVLQQGRPALLPTDTLPALAACPRAAAQIWERKRRSLRKPLILMGADVGQFLEALSVPWRQEWLEKAHSCWPGAVTLILPVEGPLTDLLHPGGASLGLRVPACTPTRELLRCSGPLATTSANLSGQPAATSALEASRLFPDLPLLGPLPWPAASGEASQVLEWLSPSGGWRILRPAAAADDPSPAP